MECPNKCGEIYKIKKPSLVPILAEVLEYVDVDYDDESIGEHVIPYFRLIIGICVECGYYQSIPLTSDEFELHLQGKLLASVS